VPQQWRAATLKFVSPSLRVLDWLTVPTIATAIHGLVIWLWHSPPLFDAALANPWIHIAQHLSFLVTALCFWWATLNVLHAAQGLAALHLFVTMLAFTALGALLTLSPHPLYVSYADASITFLTPLEDQQLGGIIMWVPGCAIYAAAALIFLGRWISPSERTAVCKI
jgi:cytochrome c oxidase assembly factor CtaG